MHATLLMVAACGREGERVGAPVGRASSRQQTAWQGGQQASTRLDHAGPPRRALRLQHPDLQGGSQGG